MKNGVCYDVNDAAAAVQSPDDERDKAARRGILSAAIVLAIGIVLEVVSTLWTFHKALSGWSFLDDVDCGVGTRIEELHKSFLAQESCAELLNTPYSSVFWLSTDTTYDYDYGYQYSYDYVERYTCDEVIDTPTGQDSFLARCVCDRD